MDDNWRTATGYICIALVFISMYIGGAWVLSPQEFTFKIEMDNNTKEAVESVEYPILDVNEKECFQRIVRYDRYIDYENGIVTSGYFYNTTWQRTECEEFEQSKYESLAVNVSTGETEDKDE